VLDRWYPLFSFPKPQPRSQLHLKLRLAIQHGERIQPSECWLYALSGELDMYHYLSGYSAGTPGGFAPNMT